MLDKEYRWDVAARAMATCIPSDAAYENAVRQILAEGTEKSDRTGTGTLSLFGLQMRFSLEHDTLPLVTTKSTWFKGIAYELLWMLHGDTNTKYLTDHGVHIWDEWADEDGNLGPIYGAQWRHAFAGIQPHYRTNANNTVDIDLGAQYVDQMQNAVTMLKSNPTSRRIVVDSWQMPALNHMALSPCHCLFQFWSDGEWLSCQLYQRSADFGLGVPFNIASYSLLTHMMAQQTGLKPKEFVWTGGDCHVYLNHIEPLLMQIARKPYPYPAIQIDKAKDLFSYNYEDFHLQYYQHWPKIAMEVSV